MQFKVSGTQQILRHQRKRTLIWYALATLWLLAYWSSGFWFRLDFVTLDQWLRLAPHLNKAPSEIVLIDIDDESINRLEPQLGRWPWPRSAYAYVLQAMEQWHPKAVVFDVLLTGSDLSHPDDDAFFLETLGRFHQVFLPVSRSSDPHSNSVVADLPKALFVDSNTARPLTLLMPLGWQLVNGKMGLINAPADSDGLFRRYPLTLSVDGVQLWSLPALVAQWQQPRRQTDTFYLNYRNSQLFPYPRITFANALAMSLQNNADYAAVFANKIVVIGSSATALADLKHTPLAAQHPGMTLLATAIDNTLNQDYLHLLPRPFSLIFFWFAAALWYWQLHQSQNSKEFLQRSTMTLVASVGLIGAAGYVALNLYWVITFGVVLALLLTTYALINTFAALAEHRARQHTHQLFSRFVDARVIKDLVADDSIVHAKKYQVTVLFTDIRNFTAISECHSPEYVMTLLNRYLALQVQTLFAHHATLDKFIGDAIMAFWGAPVPQQDQADLAIAAALALERNLIDFKQTLPAELQSFEIGIGIHTGEAVVGLLGTSQRQEYTAIGDTVNVASRLESASKQYGRIVCSVQTIEACAQPWLFQQVGEISLKGRSQPLKLYQVRGRHADTNPLDDYANPAV